MNLKALRWRCRRGMRELDQLLLAFLEQRFESADSSQQTEFVALLEAQDPEIYAYLVKGVIPDSESTAALVRDILDNACSSSIRT